MFSQIISTALSHGAVLAMAGLVIGSITGWISILSGNTIEAVATVAPFGYLSLTIVLPGILYFITRSYTQSKPTLYSHLFYSIVLLMSTTIVGCVGASLTFFVPTTNFPAIFRNLDSVVLNPLLMAKVGWFNIGIVSGVTLFAAVALAFWAHHRVNHSSSN